MENRRSKPRSKLSDVAAAAGVSSSTVSLVLAGKGEEYRISGETQDRVRRAATSLDYAPSLLHRSVRRGKTGILSFYNSFRNREAGDLYMDRLSAAIEHAGGKRGYNILVHCDFHPGVQETYEFLNGGFADGLILFAPEPDEPLLERLRASGLPTVVFNPRGPETILSTVQDDGEQGMARIAEALVENGHRRIAVFTQQSPGWPDPQLREGWLRSHLVARGVRAEDVRTVVCLRDFDASVAQAMAPAEKPTAFFVWNDRTAYDVLEASERAGYRVPGDVSIVGYDGIVWPSTSSHVVASVRVSFEGIADAAVGVLDDSIRGEAGPSHHKVAGTLALGTTLGPARPNF